VKGTVTVVDFPLNQVMSYSSMQGNADSIVAYGMSAVENWTLMETGHARLAM
jgi:hypothetical protein